VTLQTALLSGMPMDPRAAGTSVPGVERSVPGTPVTLGMDQLRGRTDDSGIQTLRVNPVMFTRA